MARVADMEIPVADGRSALLDGCIDESLFTLHLGPPFPVSALEGVAPAIPAAQLQAAIAVVEQGLEAHFLWPESISDWRPVSWDDETVVFIAGHDDVAVVTARYEDGRWRLGGYIGSCRPERYRAGARAARWQLASGDVVDGSMTEITALVTEQACASGRSCEGRILPPAVEYGAAVTITFFVTPLPGGQKCPGNPAVPYRVVLSEPVAGRQLLDGSVFPPLPIG